MPDARFGAAMVLCMVRMTGWYDVKSTIADVIMRICSTLCGSSLTLILMFVPTLRAQNGSDAYTGGGEMRQQYNDAQKLQRAGRLNEAAGQYRAFLADALGELAIGYGVARDYTRAAPLFDEALSLDPDSPSLLLDYAQMASTLGDLDHARTLATEFIRKYPGDREKLAQAHQVLGRTLLKLNRDQEARKELEAAVALDPTFANGYDLAVACLDLDDEACAVQLFGEIEKSFGDTPELHMAFGRAYGNSDFQPRAIPEFRRAIEENPRLPGAHYLLAAVLLADGDNNGHLDDAEAELKKELAISPRDAMTYAALGKIAASRNDFPGAETYLKKAISLAPQNPDSYLYLGQMYFAADRYAEAETTLRECIRLTTDVSRNRYQVQKAHFLLGRILMKKGERDAAQKEMDIARDLANKTLAQDKSKLAGLLDTSGREDASQSTGPSPIAGDPVELHKVEALREQLKPAVADSYNDLGAIAATDGSYASAVAYFEHAAVWNPSLEGLDYNWGRAAFAGAQFADAVMPLTRYLKLHSDDTGARSVLALSQFMIGNYRDCVETLQPMIGKTALVPQVEYAYAESMIRTGQVASGEEQLQALEKSHPEIPDVHRSLGEALEQQGQKQKALDELRTAIQLSPRDAGSHYDLGRLELESGDWASAIPELEAAVRLSPDDEKFHQELADAYTAARRPADARKEIETCNLLRAHAQNSASPRQTAPPVQ
jgi:tetratricopeptide (TPR) repeat protein